MLAGVIEVDLHGKNSYQAKVTLDAVLRRASGATYRIRCIHGFHGGTVLRDMIRKEYAEHPRVLRIETGIAPGVTDLILREY